MTAFDVSILICTRNRAADLRETLRSFAGLIVPEGLAVEWLVVDNGSTDNTAEVVRTTATGHVTPGYLYEDRGGQSVGLNAGIARTTGRVVLFTDDDVRVPPDWLDMARPILDGRADAVAGGVRLAPHLVRTWLTAVHRSWLASTESMTDHDAGLVGANMAVSRHALSLLGGFDPELGPGALGFMSDSILGDRLRRAKRPMASRLDLCVEHHFHPSRLTRGAFIESAQKHGRSMAHANFHYNGLSLSLPRLRQLKCLLSGMFVRRSASSDESPISVAELNAVKGRAFFDQYFIESQRPRRFWPIDPCQADRTNGIEGSST